VVLAFKIIETYHSITFDGLTKFQRVLRGSVSQTFFQVDRNCLRVLRELLIGQTLAADVITPVVEPLHGLLMSCIMSGTHLYTCVVLESQTLPGSVTDIQSEGLHTVLFVPSLLPSGSTCLCAAYMLFIVLPLWEQVCFLMYAS
jgi:hypothetical protein